MEYNEVSSREFPYEMIFIANLEVADTLVTDSVQASRLVAIADGEVRGRAVMRTAYGIPYLEIRIGSKTTYGEQISFEYYDHSHYLRHEFPAVTFDGETHRTALHGDLFNCVDDFLRHFVVAFVYSYVKGF